MAISLLPDELRKKEEEEKQKTKEAQGLPKFKLHLPEEKKPNGEARKEEKKSGIEFGHEEAAMKKGVFRVVSKSDPHLSPPLLKGRDSNLPPTPSLPRMGGVERPPTPPTVDRLPSKPLMPSTPLPPTYPPLGKEGESKPAPRPEKTARAEPLKESLMRMKFPEIKESGLNEKGAKIIRETTDKIKEIKKPKRLVEFFKKGLAAVKFKKPPAELNLVSEDYVETVKFEFWRRVKIMVAVILAFCVLTAVGFVAIKVYKISLIERYMELSDEIAMSEAEISSFSSEQAQAKRLAERVAVMDVLLKNHIYWTKVFDFLEHNIAENIYFTNFSAENSGEVTLTGAAKSYTDVAKQLFIFENSDSVSSVAINSAGKKMKTESESAPAEIEFNAALKFKEEAFKK